MNRIANIAFFLFAISALSFGQEKGKSKFGYGIGFGTGNSTLENNKFGVLNGNIYSMRFNVDYNFTDKENTKIISGVEFIDLNSSFFDGIAQSKLKNEYLQIPFRITHGIGFDKEEKLSLVVGAGLYANFLLRSRVTNLDDKINTKSGGVNFGYILLLGVDYKLSTNTSVGVYGNIMEELDAIENNGYEQKQSEILLFNVGFSTRF